MSVDALGGEVLGQGHGAGFGAYRGRPARASAQH